MNADDFLKQRLLCIAVVDDPDAAVPLAEALLAGGLKHHGNSLPHRRRR